MPPLSRYDWVSLLPRPPQTIISAPVQTAVCSARPAGAPAVEVGIQESDAGSYRAPVFWPSAPVSPPHTIISVPVQTAVAPPPGDGAPAMEVGVQVSVSGS